MIAQIALPGYFSYLPEKRIQLLIFVVVFMLQYFAEHLNPQQKKFNDGANERRNFLIGIINMLLMFIPGALTVELLSIIEQQHFGMLQQITLPFWINFLITFLLMDFAMYWWHRFNHTKIFLWYFHRFHHLDEKMNTTTAIRFHIVELLLSAIFKAIYYLLTGFSFLPILAYEILFFVVVLLQHSNIKIPVKFDLFYRLLFSSPLMHRIHHSNIQIETDTNYGSVFSCWDRLFGTYKKEARGPIVFGVDATKS